MHIIRLSTEVNTWIQRCISKTSLTLGDALNLLRKTCQGLCYRVSSAMQAAWLYCCQSCNLTISLACLMQYRL
jgi:hypothetical protein